MVRMEHRKQIAELSKTMTRTELADKFRISSATVAVIQKEFGVTPKEGKRPGRPIDADRYMELHKKLLKYQKRISPFVPTIREIMPVWSTRERECGPTT